MRANLKRLPYVEMAGCSVRIVRLDEPSLETRKLLLKTKNSPWLLALPQKVLLNMNVSQVMTQLKKLGSEQTVKIFRSHGAGGDMFGVKVGDLKKILKQIKGEQELAMELWATNNSDAMYLAALVADGSRMTKTQLNQWAKSAWWYMLSEYSVPFVAHEHPDAFSVATKWINSKPASIQTSGWTTYSATISVRDDEALDLEQTRSLLQRVEREISAAENRVRYTMNGFVISVGAYVTSLVDDAKAVAKAIGKVEVDMGGTACKVPDATATIEKIEGMGRIGKKRKTAKC